MFCHSSVPYDATSVIPPLHPEGWVKIVVRTNGPADVEAVVMVVLMSAVELDKDNERRDDGDAVVLLFALTPEVVTPMVSS
ncbi:hypothetical protein N7490_011084 [Penicillium lividum]|nr:hypothetical protein N7490_011084 [Penicillium lividum]